MAERVTLMFHPMTSSNPRKFSEKIALHRQKEAAEKAEYEKIMSECALVRKVPSSSTSLKAESALYSGSLPNVHCYIQTPESQHGNEFIFTQESFRSRKDSHRPHGSESKLSHGPIRSSRSRLDTSPYGSVSSSSHLSPPNLTTDDSSWRRTVSDSSLHQSVNQMEGFSSLRHQFVSPFSSSSTSHNKVSQESDQNEERLSSCYLEPRVGPDKPSSLPDLSHFHSKRRSSSDNYSEMEDLGSPYSSVCQLPTGGDSKCYDYLQKHGDTSKKSGNHISNDKSQSSSPANGCQNDELSQEFSRFSMLDQNFVNKSYYPFAHHERDYSDSNIHKVNYSHYHQPMNDFVQFVTSTGESRRRQFPGTPSSIPDIILTDDAGEDQELQGMSLTFDYFTDESIKADLGKLDDSMLLLLSESAVLEQQIADSFNEDHLKII